MATDDKYDRQLRLWGAHGQKLLSSSHIIVIGSSSAGTETLKNLVLPGVGKFTIIDDHKVSL
jgi:amyloid beta precursor protein binding protein 1